MKFLVSRPSWIVAALIAIAIARIVATYPVLSATMDEPDHIAAGMEWIDRGTYTYGYEHPPLARVMLAAPLYAKGVRSSGDDEMISEGNLILYTGHEHRWRLALARMGNLPFLILASVVVWLWARRWFGATAGLWAVLFFTFLPPALAHAGLATLDMAATASCALALYELIRWREEPSMTRAVVLGVALSLAVLCKFSVPVFLIACAAIGLLGLWGANLPKLRFASLLRQAAAIAGILLFLLWAGYHFNYRPIVLPKEKPEFLRVLTERVTRPELVSIASHAADIRSPYGGLARGFLELLNHNARGHQSYLLGR